MLEGNSPIPENLASQIGYCYDSIVSYDEEICFEIASKTELIPNEFDENLSSLTRDELYALQNHIKELSEERWPKLHPNTDDEEQTNQ